MDQKDAEIRELQKSHRMQELTRLTRERLADRGVTDEGRINRVLRLIDLGAVDADEGVEAPPMAIDRQLSAVAEDVPELLSPGDFKMGAGSHGSTRPVLSEERPLTAEEIERMSPEEMAKPGVLERIDRFMRGER